MSLLAVVFALSVAAVALVAQAVAVRAPTRSLRVRATLWVFSLTAVTWGAQSVLMGLFAPQSLFPGSWLAWTLPLSGVVLLSLRVLLRLIADDKVGLRVTDHLWAASYMSTMVFAFVNVDVHPYIAMRTGQGIAYGPMYWLHVIASCALLTVPVLGVVGARATVRMISLRSPLVIAVTGVAPVIASIVQITLIGPGGFDLTPFGFIVTAVMLWFSFERRGLVDVPAISRTEIFDYLADAVLVVDNNGKVVDLNARCLTLMAATADYDVIGRDLAEVWPRGVHLWQHPGEHDIVIASRLRTVDVNVTRISHSSGASQANVVLIHDVTDSAREREELEDEVTRDAATGLRNRRYLTEALPKVVDLCETQGTPLSIIILDIDHFKEINDLHGHPVGDRVLVAVARVLEEHALGGDVIRWGGEEFMVVLPGIDADGAIGAAEALRLACEGATVRARGFEVMVTLSAGAATADPPHIDSDALIDAADAALYRAKRAGRNRVRAAHDQRA